MDTQEVIRRLSSESIDEQLAVLRSLLGKDASPEVYPFLVANLTSQDEGVVFLSLTLMMKAYSARVHQDGELLRPRFLALLTSGFGPVIDRVMWGLSITGQNTVPKLIEYILQSPDDHHLQMGILALGRNGYIRQYPALVVGTIRVHLNHSNPRVRSAALSALMDMSPLKSFNRLDADSYHFEPVYQELQAVAQDLFALATTSEEQKWLGQYLDLLNNRDKY
jgi:hypothetical protein